MLSKKLLVIMIMTTLLLSTLVTDGEAAASNRKTEKAPKDETEAGADEVKEKSDVRSNVGLFDFNDDPYYQG